MILPHSLVKLGIQPLSVHTPGIVGLASRSGTISYELASQTTSLGLGQSVVFGLGGDPFPGTRTWEALHVMLHDPLTKVVCLIGEVGGQMEEEAAELYEEYTREMRAKGKEAKPVVGFIAGMQTERGKVYGHAGAVWHDDWESAGSKKRCWEKAGFVMADTLGDVGGLLKREAMRLGLA
jgi:succinyl-CoA synthetase alpha subunit